MIFVILGTQKEPFTRLLDLIEKSHLKQKVIVQAGHTKYKSTKMEIFDFKSPEEIQNLIQKANFIITHAGTGSILTALKNNKKVIACARLKKYGEHVDDHQKELAGAFAKAGYILEINDSANLDNILTKIDSFSPKPYISNTDKFIAKLKQEIEQN